MARYRVWELGGWLGEKAAQTIVANFPAQAARLWAEWFDSVNDVATIVNGHPRHVMVRDLDVTNKAERYTVAMGRQGVYKARPSG